VDEAEAEGLQQGEDTEPEAEQARMGDWEGGRYSQIFAQPPIKQVDPVLEGWERVASVCPSFTTKDSFSMTRNPAKGRTSPATELPDALTCGSAPPPHTHPPSFRLPETRIPAIALRKACLEPADWTLEYQ